MPAHLAVMAIFKANLSWGSATYCLIDLCNLLPASCLSRPLIFSSPRESLTCFPQTPGHVVLYASHKGLQFGDTEASESGFFFLDRVSLCSPSWPGTLFVAQADLKLRSACLCLLQVLGLKASRGTTPGVWFTFILVGGVYLNV